MTLSNVCLIVSTTPPLPRPNRHSMLPQLPLPWLWKPPITRRTAVSLALRLGLSPALRLPRLHFLSPSF